MTPEQQLDFVLVFIKDKIELDATFNENYIWNLYVNRRPETGINRTKFREIMQKLKADGYVREQSDGGQPFYLATFEGLIFEGYEQRKKDNETEQKRIENIQSTQIKQGKQLNTLTTFIVIGTIIAAIYYSLEILSVFFPSLFSN